MTPASALPNGPPYFPALTGLRALAALLVFWHHYSHRLNAEALGWASQLGVALLRELHIGVTIFFTLSGFLITVRYARQAPLDGRQWRRYLWRRFARIYPLYFLLTLGTFAYWHFLALANPAAPTDTRPHTLLLNLTLARGFFRDYIFSGIAPGWSLTVEECFYILAPLLFWLLFRFRGRAWVWPLAATALLAMGLGLTVLFQGQPMGLFKDYTFLFNHTFFGRFFEFFCGVFLAYMWPSLAPKLTSLALRPGTFTYAAVVLIALVVASLAFITWVTGIPYGSNHPPGIVLNNVVLPLILMALLYGLVQEDTLLARLLSSRWGQLLGRSSYAFYLIHLSVGSAWLVWHLPMPGLLPVGVLLMLLIPIAIGLHLFIEEPVNRLLRSLSASAGAI